MITFLVTGWQEMALRSTRSGRRGVAPKQQWAPTGRVSLGACPGPTWEVCEPGSKGSAKAFVRGTRAVIVNDNRAAAPWAALVQQVARQAMAGAPLTGPVEVAITFYLQRPCAHYLPVNGKRPAPVLRPDAPTHVPKKPDGDKLERCAWDALTGVVLGDDALIVRWSGEKRYADPEPVGALFTITEAL